MDRRNAIAAMAAAAALGATPLSLTSAAERGPWVRALAAHKAAQKALDDGPEDDWQRLGDQYCEAAGQMLATPAPDHPALLLKLEYLFGAEARDPGGSSATWCADYIQPVMLDAKRLLAGRA